MIRACPADTKNLCDARANWNITYFLPIDEYQAKRNTAPKWKAVQHFGTVRDLFVHMQFDPSSGQMPPELLALVEEVKNINVLPGTGYEWFTTSERRTLRIIPVTWIEGAVCFFERKDLRTVIVHQ
jgi:hypothetical protein